MNWLQRLAQGKPMPTPVTWVPDENRPGRRPTGFNLIDDVMTQETADAEIAENPDINYLGAGENGLVTDLGKDNIARKYIADEDEAANAKVQMMEPRDYIIRIHNVMEMQDGLWAIDAEKVVPLSDDEAAAVTEIWSAITEDNAIPGYDHITTEDPDIDPAVFADVHDKYLEFVQKMSEDDYFSINDAWGDNMGYAADGRMILLDLGNAHIPVFR